MLSFATTPYNGVLPKVFVTSLTTACVCKCLANYNKLLLFIEVELTLYYLQLSC